MSEMTVVGRTATGGVYRRTITAARLLRDGDVGPGAEEATRASAAVWGLPDFVFRSVVTATGSGVRERGDALIVVGEIGAVMQVKARRSSPATTTLSGGGWTRSSPKPRSRPWAQFAASRVRLVF